VALDDKVDYVRTAGVETLLNFVTIDSIPRLQQLLSDPNEWVRYWAAMGLIRAKATHLASRTLEDAISSSDATLRIRAMEALGAITDIGAATAIRYRLTDEDIYVRVAAIRTLAMLKAISLKDLEGAINDRSPDANEAAGQAIISFGGGAASILDRAIGSKNFATRMFAAAAILVSLRQAGIAHDSIFPWPQPIESEFFRVTQPFAAV
jgi:HEAT repeat protein